MNQLDEQMKQKAEEKQMAKDFAQIKADMWAYLKTQPKKELMRLVIQQANLVIEHTQLNKHLYEENLSLKEELKAFKPETPQTEGEGK